MDVFYFEWLTIELNYRQLMKLSVNGCVGEALTEEDNKLVGW